MATILVTGGAGFIGSNLCKALLKEHSKIIVIDNFSDFYSPQIKEENIIKLEKIAKQCAIKNNFIFKKIDIRDKDAVGKVFSENKIDIVVHLAACAGVRPSIENPELYYDVNVMGTINILECMRNSNVKKLVFASSSSVYGNNKKVPFSEEDIVDFPISPYASTKKSGELLCHVYYSLYSINVACLRFFTVYGPGQRPDLAIYKFTDMIIHDKPIPFFGDGESKRDYTFIDDIVDGIVKAMDWINTDEKRYNIFNIGESNTISLKNLVLTLEMAIGKKAIVNEMPKQAGDVDITNADISKAINILGYEPKMNFKEGIDIFINWYKITKLS